MSQFDSVTLAPPDPILSLTGAFKADPNPEKINLSVGVFVNDLAPRPYSRPFDLPKNAWPKQARQELFADHGDTTICQPDTAALLWRSLSHVFEQSRYHRRYTRWDRSPSCCRRIH